MAVRARRGREVVVEEFRQRAADVLSRLDGQARLAAGVFGICETCRGAIPLRRLRAMPAARHCLTCQTRREQGRPA